MKSEKKHEIRSYPRFLIKKEKGHFWLLSDIHISNKITIGVGTGLRLAGLGLRIGFGL